MNPLRTLPATAVVLLLLGSPLRAQGAPLLFPTRDVDITYDVTRPQQPKIRQRVRWLASEHLQRIDGPDKSTTIYDRKAHVVTLLSTATRTYRRLEGAPPGPMEPEAGAKFTRGGEAEVAGLHCVDWSWMEDVEKHTVCVTADGVLLRVVIDGATVIQARSVAYGPQNPKLFQVPPNYTPALAPEGDTGL